MRLLSVLIKYGILVVLLLQLSCGPSIRGVRPGRLRTLKGDVTIAGDHPFDRQILLANGKGNFWTLRSRELEGELMNLAGLQVKVWGYYVGESSAEPEMVVEHYELLPIDGRKPIIGNIYFSGDRPILIAPATGEQYVLVGPLGDALKSFAGYKVWICGDREGGAGKGRFQLDVKGYGVLGPAERGR